MNTLADVETTDNKIKLRELSPIALRLRPELRAAILREAKINSRSFHAEAVKRLEESIYGGTERNSAPGSGHLSLVASDGQATPQPPSDSERQLLALFKKMPPDKQLALLSLLRN